MTILSDIFSSITWWHCQCDEDISVYRCDQRVIISSITCSHNSQTLHLSCLITNSIFLVDWLWLLEEMLLHEWKFCMMTFLIMQCFNIIWTTLNWNLLTLLTSIRTQNRIKRFIVNIMYKWISLSVKREEEKKKKKKKKKKIIVIVIHTFLLLETSIERVIWV